MSLDCEFSHTEGGCEIYYVCLHYDVRKLGRSTVGNRIAYCRRIVHAYVTYHECMELCDSFPCIMSANLISYSHTCIKSMPFKGCCNHIKLACRLYGSLEVPHMKLTKMKASVLHISTCMSLFTRLSHKLQ